MENFRHAFSIHYPYWGGFWGWGRGAKPGTINLRGLCHFCPKKWSNFPSTKKISFVLLNITIVQLIITHINLGGAPWNGTFGFFEQCENIFYVTPPSTSYRVSHFQFGNFESLYFEKYLTEDKNSWCYVRLMRVHFVWDNKNFLKNF